MSYTSWIEAVKSIGSGEKHKEGEVWKTDLGNWRGKNPAGKPQSYVDKDDAITWSKGKIPAAAPKDEPKAEPKKEPEAQPEKEPKAEPKKEPTKTTSGTGSAVGLDTPEKRKESLVAGVVTPVGNPRDDMDFDDIKGGVVKDMKDPVILQGELKKVGLASNVDSLPENDDIEKSTKNRARALQEGLEGFANAKTDEEKAERLNELAQNRLIEMNFAEAEELRDSKNPNKFTKKKLKVYPALMSGLGKDDIVGAKSLGREMHRIANKYNLVVPISQSSKVAARSDMSGKHNEIGMVAEIMGDDDTPEAKEAKELYDTNERKLMELQDEPGSKTAKAIIERNREINRGFAKMFREDIEKNLGGEVTGAEQVGGLGHDGLLEKYGIDDKVNPTDLIIFYKDKDGKDQMYLVSAKIYKSDTSITMKNSGVKEFGNSYAGGDPPDFDEYSAEDEEFNKEVADLINLHDYRKHSKSTKKDSPFMKEKRAYKEAFAQKLGKRMQELANDPTGAPGNGKEGPPWSAGQQRMLKTWHQVHGCGYGVRTSVAITGGKEPELKLHDPDHYCEPKMPFSVDIKDTSCEIHVGDKDAKEYVKFNAKTEKDGPKALFYHATGGGSAPPASPDAEKIENSYQSLEGMIHRMYNA